MWPSWPQWKQARDICLQSLLKWPSSPQLRHTNDQNLLSWNFQHLLHSKLLSSADLEPGSMDLTRMAADWYCTKVGSSSFYWISNSIYLLLALNCISVKVWYYWVDTNSQISILTILKYRDIYVCFEATYLGKKRVLTMNILVISVSDSVVYLSDRYSCASYYISIIGTYYARNISRNCSQVTTDCSTYEKPWVTNSH